MEYCPCFSMSLVYRPLELADMLILRHTGFHPTPGRPGGPLFGNRYNSADRSLNGFSNAILLEQL